MIRALHRFCRSQSGTAAIEFGFIAPVLVAMFALVVEIGQIYQVHNATNRLATQYAIVWADCSDSPAGVCGTELNALVSSTTISNIVPQLQANDTLLSVYQVKMAGSTPTVQYASPAGSTLTAEQTAAVQAVVADKQTGVIVTATYKHRLQFFQTLVSAVLPASSLTPSILTPSYTVVQLKSCPTTGCTG